MREIEGRKKEGKTYYEPQARSKSEGRKDE